MSGALAPQGAQDVPAKRVQRDCQMVGCLMQRDVFAVNATQNVSAGIQALLTTSRPLTVFGLIISIVVDAIEGMPSGARPHISQKALEVLPPFTYGDAATPVIPIRGISRIAATLSHLLPSVELRMSVQAVSRQASRRLFQFQTITASRLSVTEILPGYGAFSTAIAAAAPHGWPRLAHEATFHDGPATESLSGDVDNASHTLQFYHARTQP